MTVRPNGDLEVDILSCKATVTAGITSAAALEKAARGYVCTESSDDDANLARFAQCFARYALTFIICRCPRNLSSISSTDNPATR
jgi:hypothetical protein